MKVNFIARNDNAEPQASEQETLQDQFQNQVIIQESNFPNPNFEGPTVIWGKLYLSISSQIFPLYINLLFR